MLKKKIISTVIALSTMISASAFAANSQYGVISEIRYNTPSDANNASLIVALEDDAIGFYNSNEFMSCYGSGVQNWYVNLDSHPIAVETLIARLELARVNGTVVRLIGAEDACATGTVNDKIDEAYFYDE